MLPLPEVPQVRLLPLTLTQIPNIPSTSVVAMVFAFGGAPVTLTNSPAVVPVTVSLGKVTVKYAVPNVTGTVPLPVPKLLKVVQSAAERHPA